MPKKFVGENSKATVARARKEAAKTEKIEKVEKAKEDAYWADDDKHVQRKQQRKAEQEGKRQEVLERKNALKQAYEQEMNQLAASSSAGKAKPPAASQKVTQAAIQAKKEAEEKQRMEEQKQKELEAKKIEVPIEDIEVNINRVNLDSNVAETVDEAITVLSGSAATPTDRHPEKRLKAAYTAFEDARLPQLKKDHPTFRLSQLKQLLKKEWQKSPDNPLNQKIMNIIN
ncbi:coiled-coil domain-containing protein domain-containing protein [Ditylenchus destructor]|uniref:Coiled-coil domain-containing protein domain-containing protein n=1 Tax=Ditylenchus destructor TaxID=166010 RepID=A0AAD4R7B8_9BILA|nr:coiled-coil domain-containing protein domain-containing protein [Ditylenchus destructor]